MKKCFRIPATCKNFHCLLEFSKISTVSYNLIETHTERFPVDYLLTLEDIGHVKTQNGEITDSDDVRTGKPQSPGHSPFFTRLVELSLATKFKNKERQTWMIVNHDIILICLPSSGLEESHHYKPLPQTNSLGDYCILWTLMLIPIAELD